MTRDFWRGRRVFVTGHTGFKGGWLSAWLIHAGSVVTGYSLPPDTSPSFYDLCALGERMTSVYGDVRDADRLAALVREAQPEIVFHLAAQPLVRRSLREPAETFAVNVMGTVHLLEAARPSSSVRSVVVVTSDKCYDVHRHGQPLAEHDALGGNDPYSASKAAAELVTNAYTRSVMAGHSIGIATARAGNVFGGGDWADDRLIPDAVRAIQRRQPLRLRNPRSVRPWQHVLDPVSGYLLLAERLCEDAGAWRGAWNFGPDQARDVAVSELAELFHRTWGQGRWVVDDDSAAGHETAMLRLNSSKARTRLGWVPRLTLEQGLEQTAAWYRLALQRPDEMFRFTCRQIAEYQSSSRLAQA